MADPAYEPMKAVLHDNVPFVDPNWVFERKLDGVRCGAIRVGGRVRLVSRSGEDTTGGYPEIVEALAVPGPDVVADGEIVAFAGSTTSFERLQGRLQIRDPVAARATGIAVYLYLFDVLWVAGRDVRQEPLLARKRELRAAVAAGGPIRLSPHRNADGVTAFRYACAHGWEGVIAKRADSPYVSSRSSDWLKLKCSRGQELVIGGWTDPKGSRQRFGALLLGYYSGDALRYAGKVGTGFDDRTLRELGDRMAALERPAAPFAADKDLPRHAHWVDPELVAQVVFTEWTRDGKLRHPRFQGVRTDKAAAEVVREEPVSSRR